jgi:uncharacterized protein
MVISRNLKVILIVSLLINVILGYVVLASFFGGEVNSLKSQIEYYKAQNKNLTRRIESLESKLEILQKQLEYYRRQANYYSSQLRSENISQEIFGSSTFNIVAVRIIQTGFFEYAYQGVTLKGLVELRPGKGQIFVNTQPKIGIDLQTSVRTATLVAENVTSTYLSRVDVTLTIMAEEEIEVVDGPSAGAAITCAIISAIRGEKLNPLVYITGTINPDGTIGPIGGVLQKALAAAEKGAKVFLVPKGQSEVTVYKEKVRKIAPGFAIIIREPYQIKLQEYLSHKGYDVKVFEVENILQAYKLMVLH